jgi:serine/threonine protein kinase
VHKGHDQDTLESFAIKEIDLMEDNGRILYRTEVRIMKLLPKHRNLPELVGHSKGREVGSIVMTYLPYPTLSSWIAEKGRIFTNLAIFILKQLVPSSLVVVSFGSHIFKFVLVGCH